MYLCFGERVVLLEEKVTVTGIFHFSKDSQFTTELETDLVQVCHARAHALTHTHTHTHTHTAYQ